MKYNNIKSILKKQIEDNVKTLWTYNEKGREFVQIYKSYSDEYEIRTPQQLLDYLNTLENAHTS